MLGYVIFGIMAAISIPLVFIFATKPKANQTNIVKYPIGIPVICFILIGSLAVFTLIDTIEKKAFDDLSFMIPLSTSLFLTFGWLANMAVSYRLEVFDDHFVYRNVLWGKRKPH